jgi:hypothetical protein
MAVLDGVSLSQSLVNVVDRLPTQRLAGTSRTGLRWTLLVASRLTKNRTETLLIILQGITSQEDFPLHSVRATG